MGLAVSDVVKAQVGVCWTFHMQVGKP